VTGIPFDLACLAIGLALSWLGTLAFPEHPGWVSIAIDVLIVFVVPYVPPFKLPGSQCGSLWSSCDPSWHTIGAKAAAVPASHWIGAAAILAAPFVMCHLFARRAGTRPAFQRRVR
jgi:hypothetical protein